MDEAWPDPATEPPEADRRQGNANPGSRRRHLVAFVVTALVVAVVVALLPIATFSVVDSLLGYESEEIFDTFTGQPVDGNDPLPPTAACVNDLAANIVGTASIVTVSGAAHIAC